MDVSGKAQNMAVKLKITVDGAEKLQLALSRTAEAITDFSPVWNEVRTAFFEIEQDQFQSGGAKGASGTWAALSPKTEAIKIQKYGTFALLAGPLIATTRLYKSLTRSTEDTIFETTKTTMAIGTSVPYAKFHQRGTRRMPARPPIDLSDKQKDDLSKVIKKSMLSIVRRRSTLKVDESNFTDIG